MGYPGTFNGVSIFGFQVKMQTVDNPRGQQINAFPGLSGRESLDQGLRGRFTNVEGRHFGSNISDLASVQETYRSFNDGRAYPLVDTRGLTWLNVKMESFEPQGQIRQLVNGFCFQDYTSRLEHL